MLRAVALALLVAAPACKGEDRAAGGPADGSAHDAESEVAVDSGEGSDAAIIADGSSTDDAVEPVDTDADVETDGSAGPDAADVAEAVDATADTGGPADGGCARYARPASRGRLPEGLVELSGLSASGLDNERLWGHNDSGDVARLYAFGVDGALHGTVDLDVAPSDWEDMSSGPCSAEGSGSCLYVGDIGDNLAARASVVVLRIAEPTDFDTQPVHEAMTLQYPDGPRDAEALFVDAAANVYLLSKESGRSAIYRAEFTPGATATLERLGELDLGALPAAGAALVTGADYDRTTGRLIVRAYSGIAEYRPGAGTDPAALIGLEGVRLAAGFEVQGEAVAWFGGGYVHAAEGGGAAIHLAVCEP